MDADEEWRWYMRITDARISDGTLKTRFANGDEFDVVTLVFPRSGAPAERVMDLKIIGDGGAVRIAFFGEHVDVGADKIREDCDPSYVRLKERSGLQGVPMRSQSAFILCDCLAHGRVVGIDGFESPEFFSKPSALHVLKAAEEYTRFPPSSLERLRKAIETCALPETDDLGGGPSRAVQRWNHLRFGLGRPLDASRFHEITRLRSR